MFVLNRRKDLVQTIFIGGGERSTTPPGSALASIIVRREKLLNVATAQNLSSLHNDTESAKSSNNFPLLQGIAWRYLYETSPD